MHTVGKQYDATIIYYANKFQHDHSVKAEPTIFEQNAGGETTSVAHRATAKLKAHTALGHDEHIIKPLYIVTEHMNRAQYSSSVKLGG